MTGLVAYPHSCWNSVDSRENRLRKPTEIFRALIYRVVSFHLPYRRSNPPPPSIGAEPRGPSSVLPGPDRPMAFWKPSTPAANSFTTGFYFPTPGAAMLRTTKGSLGNLGQPWPAVRNSHTHLRRFDCYRHLAQNVGWRRAWSDWTAAPDPRISQCLRWLQTRPPL